MKHVKKRFEFLLPKLTKCDKKMGKLKHENEKLQPKLQSSYFKFVMPKLSYVNFYPLESLEEH